MKRLYRAFTIMSFCLCLGAVSTGCGQKQSEEECIESCKKKHETNPKGGFTTPEGGTCMMECTR